MFLICFFWEIRNLKMTFLKTMTAFICSLSNLEGDRNSSLLGVIARLAEKKKKKVVTSGTSGNRCWIFHGDPFPTNIGNFNLHMYLKYLVMIQKGPYKLDLLCCIVASF